MKGLDKLEDAVKHPGGIVNCYAPVVHSDAETFGELREAGLLEELTPIGMAGGTFRITSKGREFVAAHVPPVEW